LTEEDVRGPFAQIPADLMEQAKLPVLGYQSAIEGWEKNFTPVPGCSSGSIRARTFPAGVELQAPNIHHDAPAKAATVTVSKSRRTVEALDVAGKVLAEYPATIAACTILCLSAPLR